MLLGASWWWQRSPLKVKLCHDWNTVRELWDAVGCGATHQSSLFKTRRVIMFTQWPLALLHSQLDRSIPGRPLGSSPVCGYSFKVKCYSDLEAWLLGIWLLSNLGQHPRYLLPLPPSGQHPESSSAPESLPPRNLQRNLEEKPSTLQHCPPLPLLDIIIE